MNLLNRIDARFPSSARPAPRRGAIAEAHPVSIEPRWDGPPVPIRKIFVDMADPDLSRYRPKLAGAVDDHGPLRCLGWPRCFADAGRPSRFLIYCR